MGQAHGSQTLNEEPLYNIGAVARMTGIAIPTLRAWERRYGFPEASRTPGGHRLYSDKDVRQLQWIKQRIEAGLTISQAIRALGRYQEGRAPLLGERQGRVPEPPVEGQLDLAVIYERLVQALFERSAQRADHVLGEALLVYQLEDVILEVIRPALAEMGQAWADKRVDVATEHLSTNYLRQRLVTWMLSGPLPRLAAPVVLACAPGEWHEGSLLMLGVLLRYRRWPVVYLGQSVPLPDLAELVRQVKSQLVVLVAMTEKPARALLAWPTCLAEAQRTGRPIVGYGGRAFNERPERRVSMPGIFLGSSLREGVGKIESILQGQADGLESAPC